MSTKQKALDRMRENPRNVRFEDLIKVLEWYGFTQRQTRHGTSHHIYVPPVAARGLQGVPAHVSVPYKRPHVGQNYVREVLQILDTIDAAGLGPQD